MASLNKVMLIGNIGNDPEMRFTPTGNPLTTFNLAVSRNYTTKNGERQRETEWFTILAWNRLAETCNQFLSKGQRTYVEGRLRSRSWEGKDGQMRFRNEVIANTVIFLERPPAAAQLPGEGGGRPEEGGGRPEEGGGPEEEIEPEEVPF